MIQIYPDAVAFEAIQDHILDDNDVKSLLRTYFSIYQRVNVHTWQFI